MGGVGSEIPLAAGVTMPMLKIDIISVQPKMFEGFLKESIVARAVKKGACEINIVDLREFGEGRWRKVDDKPYGGGPGMLMCCKPWFAAVEHCLGEEVRRWEGEKVRDGNLRIIMTSPAGKAFTQRDAEMLAGIFLPPSHPPTLSPSHPLTLSSSAGITRDLTHASRRWRRTSTRSETS